MSTAPLLSCICTRCQCCQVELAHLRGLHTHRQCHHHAETMPVALLSDPQQHQWLSMPLYHLQARPLQLRLSPDVTHVSMLMLMSMLNLMRASLLVAATRSQSTRCFDIVLSHGALITHTAAAVSYTGQVCKAAVPESRLAISVLPQSHDKQGTNLIVCRNIKHQEEMSSFLGHETHEVTCDLLDSFN